LVADVLEPLLARGMVTEEARPRRDEVLVHSRDHKHRLGQRTALTSGNLDGPLDGRPLTLK